ncbi:hypothetical protein PAXRUDRAFT_824924 [Paxillus rubicundulus Ve08.2h10]|uniref:Uncharacterized protein n=1 Tax=Paxillus rubicundulus Ve08.2h10 TaxID=930991 RepID=A0A0D0EBD4_9AGAM|nr:hypothetical protein PAXRUDRAFT_824924 [Paxillus rubicundulus Ve08.2h10]
MNRASNPRNERKSPKHEAPRERREDQAFRSNTGIGGPSRYTDEVLARKQIGSMKGRSW